MNNKKQKQSKQIYILSTAVFFTFILLIIIFIISFSRFIRKTNTEELNFEIQKMINQIKYLDQKNENIIKKIIITNDPELIIKSRKIEEEMKKVILDGAEKIPKNFRIKALVQADINREYIGNIHENVINLVKLQQIDIANSLVYSEKYQKYHDNLEYEFSKVSLSVSEPLSFQKTIGDIIYYNEALRESLWIITHSENITLLNYYIDSEKKLNYAVRFSKKLIIPFINNDSFNNFFSSYNEIKEIETEIKDLILQNNFNDAKNIINSDIYITKKNNFNKELNLFLKQLDDTSISIIKRKKFILIIILFIVILISILLIVSWIIVIKTLMKWQNELNNSREKLKTLNYKLEEKVKQKVKELNIYVVTDELTGLPNRVQLKKDIINKKWKTVILLDIYKFANINAAFGPISGNKILKKISEKLNNIIPKKSKLYRINSDEFIILSEQIIEQEYKIRNINKKINSPPLQYNDINLIIKFIIGVVINEKKDLLKKANLALMRAKKIGPSGFVIYNKTFEEKNIFKENITWIKKVQNAIKTDHIIPYFQGIYNNKTKKINYYECLVRLKENNKIITPYYFLEPVKNSGLLPKITYIMINKSFQYFKNFNNRFSINLSQEDLLDESFIIYVKKFLDIYEINPERVTFEILETASSENIKETFSTLKQLKDLGLKIAIDDFGINYSNFERLVEMNADYIKIDGSFIKTIENNDKSYEIVKSITKFGHSLNIKIIAEFVSNKNIQDIVKSLNIDYSQGYYFSVPDSKILNQ